MSESQASVLIDRITAGEADAAEFRAFESLAKREPQGWEQLARALRDELDMRSALHAEDHAVRAEAEVTRAATRSHGHDAAQRRRGPTVPVFTFRAWSGWAAAAMIAIAWTIFAVAPTEPHEPMTSPAPRAQFASYTADDAFERYLELGHSEGRVIRELPARMIEMESDEDGGMVVYYIRQLLERERVNEMYQYAEDELGRPMAVPIDFTSISVTDSSL